jgi:adenine deaminase
MPSVELMPSARYEIADIVIVDEERISNVNVVLINGKVVVESGCHPGEWLPIRSPPMETDTLYGEGRYVIQDIYTKLTP